MAHNMYENLKKFQKESKMQKSTYEFDFFTELQKDTFFIEYNPKGNTYLDKFLCLFGFKDGCWETYIHLSLEEKEFGSDWVKDLFTFIAKNHNTIPQVGELLYNIRGEWE